MFRRKSCTADGTVGNTASIVRHQAHKKGAPAQILAYQAPHELSDSPGKTAALTGADLFLTILFDVLCN